MNSIRDRTFSYHLGLYKEELSLDWKPAKCSHLSFLLWDLVFCFVKTRLWPTIIYNTNRFYVTWNLRHHIRFSKVVSRDSGFLSHYPHVEGVVIDQRLVLTETKCTLCFSTERIANCRCVCKKCKPSCYACLLSQTSSLWRWRRKAAEPTRNLLQFWRTEEVRSSTSGRKPCVPCLARSLAHSSIIVDSRGVLSCCHEKTWL